MPSQAHINSVDLEEVIYLQNRGHKRGLPIFCLKLMKLSGLSFCYKVMETSSTMTSGGKISTKGIPTSTEFVPKPKEVKVQKPALVKPMNDVINPLQVNIACFSFYDKAYGSVVEWLGR